MDRFEHLLPVSEERIRLLDDVVRRIDGFWEELPSRPIGPVAGPEARNAWLESVDYEAPMAMEALFEKVFAELVDGTLLSSHPRCFGLFNPTPTFAGVVADLMTAAVNPQLAAASHAPIAVEIEQHVTKAVAERLGMPNGSEGHFTSGGAEANNTATLAAITWKEPAFADGGMAALAGKPVFYVSAESHFAWFKIAHQMGIGRTSVRLVPTDGSGRMNADVLDEMIVSDVANGYCPFMVAATAGTTNAGMVDPLPRIREIASAHGLWFHVDAAWGGALVASDLHRSALQGIGTADSITVDAHKWFSVPMAAGMFFTTHPQVLRNVFRVTTSYMPDPENTSDPYVTTMQWSRRLIGLKLFLTLASAGWQGMAEMVEENLKLASHLRDRLRAEGWLVPNDSPVGVVCFADATNQATISDIVAEVQSRQHAWISLAEYEKKKWGRACITSYRCTSADVDALVEELGLARDRVTRQAA